MLSISHRIASPVHRSGPAAPVRSTATNAVVDLFKTDHSPVSVLLVKIRSRFHRIMPLWEIFRVSRWLAYSIGGSDSGYGGGEGRYIVAGRLWPSVSSGLA